MPNRAVFRLESDPEYEVRVGREHADLAAIHGYLRRSYWAEEIPLAVVQRALDHSFCINLYRKNAQIGFTRVITDYATFAYICDVYVLEEYRGKALGKWMMKITMALPELQGLKRWVLTTKDAHGLYEQVGFKNPAHPEWFMEISRMGIYKASPIDPV